MISEKAYLKQLDDFLFQRGIGRDDLCSWLVKDGLMVGLATAVATNLFAGKRTRQTCFLFGVWFSHRLCEIDSQHD